MAVQMPRTGSVFCHGGKGSPSGARCRQYCSGCLDLPCKGSTRGVHVTVGSRSSVFCHGGKGSPSGALCRRSSSTVHRSIYYQTLLSVLCYHLDSLVCLFVVFMFHPVTQGNENQSIRLEFESECCLPNNRVRVWATPYLH